MGFKDDDDETPGALRPLRAVTAVEPHDRGDRALRIAYGHVLDGLEQALAVKDLPDDARRDLAETARLAAEVAGVRSLRLASGM